MTGEDHDYRAVFAHVGVSDLTDWQTVALRLAERYVPELISVPPFNHLVEHRRYGMASPFGGFCASTHWYSKHRAMVR